MRSTTVGRVSAARAVRATTSVVLLATAVSGLAAQTSDRSRADALEKRATDRQMDAVEKLLADAEVSRSLLITSNLRLVVSIAKKFVNADDTFDELVAEGVDCVVDNVGRYYFRFDDSDSDWFVRLHLSGHPAVRIDTVVLRKGANSASLSTDVATYRSELLTVARRFIAGKRGIPE